MGIGLSIYNTRIKAQFISFILEEIKPFAEDSIVPISTIVYCLQRYDSFQIIIINKIFNPADATSSFRVPPISISFYNYAFDIKKVNNLLAISSITFHFMPR